MIRRVDGLKVCVFAKNLHKLLNKNLYLYVGLRDSAKIILSGQTYQDWLEEREEVEVGCCVRLIRIQNQQNTKIHYIIHVIYILLG